MRHGERRACGLSLAPIVAIGRCAQSVMGCIAAVIGDDVAADDACAGRQVRRQPAGNAEADDAVAALPNGGLDGLPELQLAAAANRRLCPDLRRCALRTPAPSPQRNAVHAKPRQSPFTLSDAQNRAESPVINPRIRTTASGRMRFGYCRPRTKAWVMSRFQVCREISCADRDFRCHMPNAIATSSWSTSALR